MLAAVDPRYQSVLAMQGKPINAAKRSPGAVAKYVWGRRLRQQLAAAADEPFATSNDAMVEPDPDTSPFDRILIAMDGDVDGIHCAALTIVLVRHLLPRWIEMLRVHRIHPPLFENTAAGEIHYAWTQPEHRNQLDRFEQLGIPDVQTVRYRGLAAMPTRVLRRTVVDAKTRFATPIDPSTADSITRQLS